jgi:hypothetical protein
MSGELTDIIGRAQALSGAPRNVRAVVAQMMHGELWDEIIADPIVHKMIVRAGLDLRVAAFIKQLKKTAVDGVLDALPLSEPMLALWPEGPARELVVKIDRAAVYVPREGEYVDMLPDVLTPETAIEAGQHLIAHGEDTIRRGQYLIDLGEMGW